jgi:Protein of unknown function (DUF3485)
MMKKPWLLPLFLAATFSAVYFLPKVGAVAQSAINMQLPATSGSWQFRVQSASQDEIEILKGDTQFSKAICLAARNGEYDHQGRIIPDRLDLSIVLSGVDINNSIHRPERCMPAQGHSILSSGNKILTLSNGRDLSIKRLQSIQAKRVDADSEKEEYTKHRCLTYYFFVGHDRVTNDHLGRTFIDMKDRLIRGLDQRWAYISVSMWYGNVPWIKGEVSEAEADQKLQQFLIDFTQNQIDWNKVIP